MASEVNVFIAAEGGLHAVVECLRCEGKFPLTRSSQQDSLYEGFCCGVFLAVFNNHGLKDDMGISFSKYEVEVSFTRFVGPIDATTGHELCKAMAMAASELLSENLGAKFMVVEGVETVLRASDT